MGGLFKLAWRNLGRNRRRTLITGLGLALGMSLCVASYGLVDGMNVDILNALTRLDLGHVQVHHPDYVRKRDLKLSMPGHVEALEAARKLPQFLGMTRRVYGFGLASHESKSAGVQLVGVDPTTERTVTTLHKHLTQGKYLDSGPTPWPRGRKQTDAEKVKDEAITRSAEDDVMAEIEGMGTVDTDESKKEGAGGEQDKDTGTWTRKLANELNPAPARPPRVFIGSELARILKLKLGDRVFLMTQTLDGMAAEVYLQVGGVITTGTSLYDRGRIYMHIADLQRFLHMDNRVHEVALAASKASEARELAAGVSELLRAAGLAPTALSVETDNNTDGEKAIGETAAGEKAAETEAAGKKAPAKKAVAGGPTVMKAEAWDELRPDIKSILQLNEVSTAIMVLIIFIVAALGVINTMLMAVFERTRELGMLKAIGLSGGRVLMLILVETLLLVLVASAVGTGIGLALDAYMIVYGVDLSFVTEGISIGGVGMNPVIHGAITLEGVLVPAFTLSFICFLGAFYPAARAARMRPAQGMREV